EASETATGSVNQSLKELQTSHIAATETTGEAVNRSIRELREAAELATQSAAKTITRTLKELQDTTQAAVEQSTQSASAAAHQIQTTQNKRPSPRSRRRKTCCGRIRPPSTSACARPTSCFRKSSAARMRT